jgi:hypothetical protein
MYYLLAITMFIVCNAMQKKAFYNPVQVYYQSASIPATSQAIIMDPKANPKQNIVEYSLKLKNKPLPDYKIPQWVHEKVFRHNKPNKYAFDHE